MNFDVFGQVVTAGELLLAHLTLIWFDTRVGTPVSRQLVGPGKPEKMKRSFHESEELNLDKKKKHN